MRSSTRILAMVCIAIAWVSTSTWAGSIPSALVGTWVGSAGNTNAAPSNALMPLTLVISADGAVSGRLGAAVLEAGSIRKNRGALGRFFNMKSDYLIYADLEGSLFADKDIRYEGVFINMNVEDGKVVAAGFTTTHSRFGTPITKQGLVMGSVSLQKESAPPK